MTSSPTSWSTSRFKVTEPTEEYLPSFPVDTPEADLGFRAYVDAACEQPGTQMMFESVLGPFPRGTIIRENGPAHGVRTVELCKKFRVIAVEPSPEARTGLKLNLSRHLIPFVETRAGCEFEMPKITPFVVIVDGGAEDSVHAINAKTEVRIDRHLYYHVPDEKVPALLTAGLDEIGGDGVFWATLKSPMTGDNAMLEHFGFKRFDLNASIMSAFARSPEVRFERRTTKCTIEPKSFEQAAMIAAFMVWDRTCAGLLTTMPKWKNEARLRGRLEWRAFLDYVQDKLWRGGDVQWPHFHDHYLVRHETFFLQDTRK